MSGASGRDIQYISSIAYNSLGESLRGRRELSASPMGGGTMNSDLRASADDSSWSGARRNSMIDLLQALDRSPAASNANTRAALFAFVDVLAHESLAPEAVVIALKD